MRVKACKVGHSLVLPVPKALAIRAGQEFDVHQNSDGAIVYTPKHQNPFEGYWFKNELKQDETMSSHDLEASEWN